MINKGAFQQRYTPYGNPQTQGYGGSFNNGMGQMPPHDPYAGMFPPSGGMGQQLLGMPQQQPAYGQYDGNVEEGTLKVSAHSDPKRVAGKIAHSVRTAFAPRMVARGDTAVNIATKSIAIARSYLKKDQLDIFCRPHHKNDGDNDTGRSVVFVLAKKNGVDIGRPDRCVDLKVAKTSQPSVLAGAVASQVRDNKNVTIEAVGSACVNNSVNSIVLARRYLDQSGDKMDLSFQPEFVTVEWKGNRTSALQCHIKSNPK